MIVYVKVWVHCIMISLWESEEESIFVTITFVLHIFIKSESIVLEPLPSNLPRSKVTDVEVYKKYSVSIFLENKCFGKANLKTKTTLLSLLGENSSKLSIRIRNDIFGEAPKMRNTLQDFAKSEGYLSKYLQIVRALW